MKLEVTDDGPGMSAEDNIADEFTSSSGVGISNIKNRLAEIYGERHELIFSNRDPQGLKVTVVIPYDTKR